MHCKRVSILLLVLVSVCATAPPVMAAEPAADATAPVVWTASSNGTAHWRSLAEPFCQALFAGGLVLLLGVRERAGRPADRET